MSRGGRHPHTRGLGATSQRARDRLVTSLRRSGVVDERVLEAIARVPRHEFIDEALSYRAYEDTALPIGHGQTISQPFVVAQMTSVLLGDPAPERVLDVGTGSGYQAAVLGELVDEVYTVERIPTLYKRSRARLSALGYRNVHVRLVDGALGLPDYGPFGAILVAAAAQEIPEALVEQLAEGGRLIAPVGADGGQLLTLIQRVGGNLERTTLDPVSFVPLLAGVQS